jgi:hypothetical protein
MDGIEMGIENKHYSGKLIVDKEAFREYEDLLVEILSRKK